MKQKLPINLSTSRWLAYATASAASTLVSAPYTEAEIHYSGILRTNFTGYDTKAFPLASGASINFHHFPSQSSSDQYAAGLAEVTMLGGSIAGFIGHTCVYFHDATASKLDYGVSIAHHPFTQRPGVLAFDSISIFECSRVHGEFGDRTPAYVGFRFDVGKGMQYGWARLRFIGYYSAKFQLLDYAYADPGETIRAGQRKKHPVNGMAEESLGALALGAVGLAAWRKWRHRKDD